jgi:hypothetical protein
MQAAAGDNDKGVSALYMWPTALPLQFLMQVIMADVFLSLLPPIQVLLAQSLSASACA